MNLNLKYTAVAVTCLGCLNTPERKTLIEDIDATESNTNNDLPDTASDGSTEPDTFTDITTDTPVVGPRLVPLCITAADFIDKEWGTAYTFGKDTECDGLNQFAWWDMTLGVACAFKTWDATSWTWVDGGDLCLPLTSPIVMPNGDSLGLVSLLGSKTYFRSLTPCGAGKPVPLFRVADPKLPPAPLDLPVKYGFDPLTEEWWPLADTDGNVVPATGTAYTYITNPAAECKVFGPATETGYPTVVPTADEPLDPAAVFVTTTD